MIHVLATVELVEGKRDEYIKKAQELIPKVRAEKGCLEYGIAIDIPASHPKQVPLRNNVVTFVEKWADLKTLEIHGQSPHMIAWGKENQSIVKAVTLQIMKPT